MNKPHSKDKKSNASHKVKATPKSFNNSGFRVDSQQSEVVRRRSPAQSCSVLHAHRLNTDLFAHNCWIKAWTYWAIFVLVVHFCCLQNLSHLTNPIMGIFRIQTGVWTKNLKEKPWNKDHTHCHSFVVNKDMFLKTHLFWNKCLGFSVSPWVFTKVKHDPSKLCDHRFINPEALLFRFGIGQNLLKPWTLQGFKVGIKVSSRKHKSTKRCISLNDQQRVVFEESYFPLTPLLKPPTLPWNKLMSSLVWKRSLVLLSVILLVCCMWAMILELKCVAWLWLTGGWSMGVFTGPSVVRLCYVDTKRTFLNQ